MHSAGRRGHSGDAVSGADVAPPRPPRVSGHPLGCARARCLVLAGSPEWGYCRVFLVGRRELSVQLAAGTVGGGGGVWRPAVGVRTDVEDHPASVTRSAAGRQPTDRAPSRATPWRGRSAAALAGGRRRCEQVGRGTRCPLLNTKSAPSRGARTGIRMWQRTGPPQPMKGTTVEQRPAIGCSLERNVQKGGFSVSFCVRCALVEAPTAAYAHPPLQHGRTCRARCGTLGLRVLVLPPLLLGWHLRGGGRWPGSTQGCQRGIATPPPPSQQSG